MFCTPVEDNLSVTSSRPIIKKHLSVSRSLSQALAIELSSSLSIDSLVRPLMREAVPPLLYPGGRPCLFLTRHRSTNQWGL